MIGKEMTKYVSKLSFVCKGLQLQFPNSGFTLDMDAVINGVYEKYFKDLVFNSKYYRSISEVNSDKFHNLLDSHTNQRETITPTIEDIWIFGYGSLMWKADYPFIDRRRGFIRGYQRRFYQNSIDHRGTPEKPGRVVTLIPTGLETDRVYGIAYRIAARQKPDVLKHLDYREKNGYERCEVQFEEFPETTTAKHFNIIMYIATQENESYAGDVWQIPCIAEQIFTSTGPSGPNRDYLLNLAQVMRMLFPGVHDDHLFQLEKEVLMLINNDEASMLEAALKSEIAGVLKSVEEQGDETSLSLESIREQIMEFQTYCTKSGWKEELLKKTSYKNHSHPL